MAAPSGTFNSSNHVFDNILVVLTSLNDIPVPSYPLLRTVIWSVMCLSLRAVKSAIDEEASQRNDCKESKDRTIGAKRVISAQTHGTHPPSYVIFAATTLMWTSYSYVDCAWRRTLVLCLILSKALSMTSFSCGLYAVPHSSLCVGDVRTSDRGEEEKRRRRVGKRRAQKNDGGKDDNLPWYPPT